ncbi:hypothetical protein NBRC10513_002905 [Rhodotorula toruloides]
MADALKAEGNTAWSQKNWNKAIDCWTKAIKKEKDAVARPRCTRIARPPTSRSTSTTLRCEMRRRRS